MQRWRAGRRPHSSLDRPRPEQTKSGSRTQEFREQHIATRRGGEGSGEEAMLAPGGMATER
jgi:hypothetical protein